MQDCIQIYNKDIDAVKIFALFRILANRVENSGVTKVILKLYSIH